MSGSSEITLFLGRFHPLLVHLPIGLIVLLAFLELLARKPRFRTAAASAGFILSLAVPTVIATVACGWLLSFAGGYDEGLLRWHKWTGIATAGACIIAAMLYSLDLKKPYRVCLFGTSLALILASHFGGSLTHGSDYLARYAPSALRHLVGARDVPQSADLSSRDAAQTPVFAGIMRPMLQDHCVSCHGAEKAKGGLRLDSLAALLKGGKGGPVLQVGNASQSELIKRVLLPVTDEDHMPPEGKPQPTLDDIALLQWWIDSGARGESKLGELKPTPQVARILRERFQAPAPVPAASRRCPGL